jgi:predicted ABC-type ATPase
VDGTGDSTPGKFMAKLDAQAALGREVKVVMVDIPTKVAIERAEKRAQRTGRFVPTEEIIKVHGSVAFNHLQWRDTQNNWEVWANDDKPKLIAKRENGAPMVILDEARYAEALAKAKEATS